jgi:hypothetical protein
MAGLFFNSRAFGNREKIKFSFQTIKDYKLHSLCVQENKNSEIIVSFLHNLHGDFLFYLLFFWFCFWQRVNYLEGFYTCSISYQWLGETPLSGVYSPCHRYYATTTLACLLYATSRFASCVPKVLHVTSSTCTCDMYRSSQDAANTSNLERK